MDYEKINWKNQPNKQTPINATNLNHMDDGIYEAHERIDANSIISTAQGETILVTDSAKVPPENIKLFGKTTQVNTEGNQLFDGTVINAIGSTNGTLISSTLKSAIIPITGGQTYTISVMTKDVIFTSTTSEYPAVNVALVDAYSGASGNSVSSKTVVTSANANYLVVGFGNGVDIHTGEIMVNIGTTALPFEPYTGGKPSPSIDYPQELNSCGDDGSIEQKLLNKNLLKNTGTTTTKNGITFTVNEDKSVTCNGTATAEVVFTLNPNLTIEVGKRCVLSGCPVGGNKNTYYLAVSNFQNDFGSGSVGWINFFKTLYAAIVIKAGTTVSNLIFYPMVRHADIEDDTYEPYTEQTLTSLTPNGLPGLPLGQTILDEIKNSPIHMSGVYHDGEQYWIGDTKEYKRGKNVHRILKVVLDGSTAYGFNNGGIWHLSSSSIQTISGGEIMSFADLHGYKNPSLSNYFITQSDSYGGVANEWEEYYNTMCVTGSGGSIAINAGMFPTPDDDGFKAFFTEHPTEIYAIAKEPIETDLTSEELAQYDALYMNYPNTTITNDAGAYMEVEYVASPKEYIANLEKKHDNDIQQLKTAIIALGGTM